jgi:hypothetical protein
MALPNIFSTEVSDDVVNRINKLTASTPALWGTMTVSQMLAHCCVTYEMVYENKHPKPNFILSIILKAFIKGVVTGEKPYKKSSQTAPPFIITDERNFEKEKKRLIDFIYKTQQLGDKHFDYKESLSFGKLNMQQWNNMFYKHLNHHLSQFGA